MLDTLLDHALEEWRVITQAPGAFIVCVFLAAILIFLGLEWFHSEKTETQEQRISLLQQENTSLQGKLDESRLALKTTAEAAATPVPIAKTAHLSLHSYGDNRLPTKISDPENVFRWYLLRTLVTEIDRSTGQSTDHEAATTLYISFEPIVSVGTLTVSSPDVKIPIYEVKEFNPRFAIIVFSGPLPAGTVEVNVVP